MDTNYPTTFCPPGCNCHICQNARSSAMVTEGMEQSNIPFNSSDSYTENSY